MAFPRNTSRVVKVAYYMFHLTRTSVGMLNRHAIREINNARPPGVALERPLIPLVRQRFTRITTSWLLQRWDSLNVPVPS